MSLRPAFAVFGIPLLLTLAGQAAADARGAQGPPEVLVSRQLLEDQGLAVGDLVQFSASPKGGRAVAYRIAGAYEPTPDPMKLGTKQLEARFHLPELIALTADPSDPLSRESVTSLNVALEDPEDRVRFCSDLISRTPGIVAAPAAPRSIETETFTVLDRFHFAIAIVTVIGSTAFLLALMVMRAEERRETIGTLRLIGFTRGRILLEVLFEGSFIALAGAIFGVLFAAATQGTVNRFFQWHYDTALVFVRVTVPIAARCVALAVPLGVLAGLVASWTLLRRDIVALLRR